MRLWTLHMFLSGGQAVALTFKTGEAMEREHAKLWVEGEPKPVGGVHLISAAAQAYSAAHLVDDFGGSFSVRLKDLSGSLMTDEVEGSEAGIERGLLQARSQMKAQQRASRDSTLNGGGMPASGLAIPPMANITHPRGRG